MSAAGTSVLVIDDETAVRRVVRRILEPEGFGVLEAPDGTAGLRTVQRLRSPAVVLTDLQMPLLGGEKVALGLAVFRPELSVVCMTAQEAPPSLAPYPQLRKPFTPGQLLAAVRLVLTRWSEIRGGVAAARSSVLRSRPDSALARAHTLFVRSGDLVAATLELCGGEA